MKKIEPTDPLARSADLVAENVGHLKRLFPEIVTEGQIDFEVLRQLLGGEVEDQEERYGFNWHGKRAARQLAFAPSTATLRPLRDESRNWEATRNIFIDGDNLEALKLLQRSMKFDVIYIDPPYNTGAEDFIYHDDYKEPITSYLEQTGQLHDGRQQSSQTETSGRRHTRWLNMIYPRLLLARNMLKEGGVIAVSIDNNEYANLHAVMSGVFGEENWVNSIVWISNLKGRQIQAAGAASTYEFVLVFGLNKETTALFTVGIEAAKAKMPSAYKGFNYEVKRDSKGEYVLKNQLYNTNSAFNEVTRPNLVFNIHHNEVTGETKTTDIDDPTEFSGFEKIVPHPCSDGRHQYHAWRWSRDKVSAESDELAFVRTPSGLRVFTKVRSHSTTTLKDVITDVSTSDGRKDLEALIKGNVFDYPKPKDLVKFIVSAAMGENSSGEILDFFAGSGTTFDAVTSLNAETGSHHRVVSIQIPQNAESEAAVEFCRSIGKPAKISEITKERARRAAHRLQTESPLSPVDAGFRVFRLDSSNLRAWDPETRNLAADLEAHARHDKSDRTEEDLLYEVILKRGLDLCVDVATKTIAGKTVFSVGGGILVCCFAPAIGASEVDAIGTGIAAWIEELKPADTPALLFRDSAFADDVAKTNLTETLRQHGLENVRSL